jgi:hypothetical protein
MSKQQQQQKKETEHLPQLINAKRSYSVDSRDHR